MMLFQLYSLTLGLHHDARFLRLPGAVQLARDALNNLIVAYQSERHEGGGARLQ
jgi:hypothetical protein